MPSKHPEYRAAELLDEYIGERLLGGTPSVDQFLTRCPNTERDHLQEAFGGVDIVLNYHQSVVTESLVKDTITKLREIWKKEQLHAKWQKQLTEWNPTATKDPVADVQSFLDFPAAAVAEANVRAKTLSQASVRFRGAPTESTRNDSHIEDAMITAIEKQLTVRAEELRRRAGAKGVPVDLDVIADTLFLCVRRVPLDNVDGCLVSNGDNGVILLNSRTSNHYRERFTFAHEIGHFVLHQSLRVHKDSSGSLNDYNSLEETQANIFAAMLLMPDSLLPQNFGAEKPSFDEAQDIQNIFDVSLSAAMRRMVRSSHWGCAFVVFKDAKFLWGVRSPYFEGWIQFRIHPLSAAADLVNSHSKTDLVRTVPAAAWINTRDDDENQDQTLLEHSRRVGDGYVYTLLTQPFEE